MTKPIPDGYNDLGLIPRRHPESPKEPQTTLPLKDAGIPQTLSDQVLRHSARIRTIHKRSLYRGIRSQGQPSACTTVAPADAIGPGGAW